MKIVRAIWLMIVGLLASACGTLPDGRGWGEDVTLLPGWSRVGQAALDALTSPNFWIPAGGAVIFRIGSLDKSLSDWASEKTPIFGSQENADDWSSRFHRLSDVTFVTTALITPSGDEAGPWAWNKVKGLAVGIGAMTLNEVTTDALKSAVGRQRPPPNEPGSPEPNDRSFPSGNASSVSSGMTLSARNVDSIAMPSEARTALKVGFHGVTALSAWSRLEARAHYPSDVLAGVALGYYISAFIHDTFMGLGSEVTVQVQPSTDGVQAAVAIRF